MCEYGRSGHLQTKRVPKHNKVQSAWLASQHNGQLKMTSPLDTDHTIEPTDHQDQPMKTVLLLGTLGDLAISWMIYG